MLRRAVGWTLVVGTIVGARPILAQGWTAPGIRARIVLADGSRIVGSLVQRVRDTVEIFPEAAFKPLHVPVAQFRRIEIEKGSPDRTEFAGCVVTSALAELGRAAHAAPINERECVSRDPAPRIPARLENDAVRSIIRRSGPRRSAIAP